MEACWVDSVRPEGRRRSSYLGGSIGILSEQQSRNRSCTSRSWSALAGLGGADLWQAPPHCHGRQSCPRPRAPLGPRHLRCHPVGTQLPGLLGSAVAVCVACREEAVPLHLRGLGASGGAPPRRALERLLQPWGRDHGECHWQDCDHRASRSLPLGAPHGSRECEPCGRAVAHGTAAPSSSSHGSGGSCIVGGCGLRWGDACLVFPCAAARASPRARRWLGSDCDSGTVAA
mmetsp:Transcript_11643/g.27361  ORF Transcript_11643/g.27361 Transcript_11643/m.27361 type:complete len:231 (+) Transcript_11643:330-1022(+)